MSETKHTPGPWDFMVGKTLLHIETNIDNPVGAGIPICSIPKSNRANARLIAAAPDLLNSLKLALGIIENYQIDIRTAIEAGKLSPGYCQGRIYLKGHDDIAAVIAKAEDKP